MIIEFDYVDEGPTKFLDKIAPLVASGAVEVLEHREIGPAGGNPFVRLIFSQEGMDAANRRRPVVLRKGGVGP